MLVHSYHTMHHFSTCSDVVSFASLTGRLQPHEVVSLVDHLNAIIDEAYKDKDIFIMERSSDGCIAVSGLTETGPEEEERNATASPISMTDSSYGSEFDLDDFKEVSINPKRDLIMKVRGHSGQLKPLQSAVALPPSHYAAILASATLKLMSFSTRFKVHGAANKQLQLRIALHSGPCSAGVVGLQTSAGATRIPHYKLFGPTVKHTTNLCTTGLALQIRVSKSCRDLLLKAGGFHFERCPDYTLWASQKPIESFWLVGKEGLALKLPSLEHALSLSEYEDIEV